MTRNMKDSGIEWIKEIPIEWKVCKGKNVLELLKRPTEDNCGVITCFRDGEVTLRSNRREQGFTFSDKEIGYQGIKSGDLVIHGMDGFAGAIGIADSDGKGSPVLNVCKPKDKYNVYFIQYYLRMLASQDVFLALATGIRERSCDLRWSKIANLLFPIPPIEEQSLIANYLDNRCNKIEQTIEKEKKVIEKLKEYKQSIITEAVTKGLNPDVKMKDSGVEWIGEIPEHWYVSRFSFETWVRARLGWKGLKADEYVDDGYIFLATPNIKDRNIDFHNVNYIDEFRYEESPEIKLSIGDVLLTKDGSTLGTVNVVRYLPKGTTVNSSIAVITPSENLDGIYLMYQIKGDYIKKIIENKKDGMGVPHLFQKDINKIYITMPPLEEQKQIGEYLDKKCDDIDKVILSKEKLIEKLTEYKKSLIYECVTGKREV